MFYFTSYQLAWPSLSCQTRQTLPDFPSLAKSLYQLKQGYYCNHLSVHLDSTHTPYPTAELDTPHQSLHGSQHVAMQHHLSSSELNCKLCALSFSSTNLLKLHRNSHHSSTIHCSFCEYSCRDMRLLNIHVQESHGCVVDTPIFDASTCPMPFTCSLAHFVLRASQKK